MITTFIILALFLVVYIGYRIFRTVMLADGLDKKILNGAIILDVRTVEEYATGHIDGSINISLGTIRKKYVKLDPDKTYITTCSHGIRSVKVKKLLKERGFNKVFNGGVWTDLEKIMNKQKKR